MRLLYVEDVPAQAEVIETFLELADGTYEVHHVETFAQTRASLSTEKFDIILLDLGLPDGEGLELVVEVEQLAGDTPIVVLTSAEDSGLGVACLQAGAQDFLNKRELTPEKLSKSLVYALTRSSGEALDPDRVLSKVKALHSGDIGKIGQKSIDRYREILTQPKLLFTVEHWTLSQAFARQGATSEQVLALHAHCLKSICDACDPKQCSRVLANSELVALATVAFMSDTYRELCKD